MEVVNRRRPLHGRDRQGWRVALLVLTLDACRGAAASVEQLHVIVPALRDDANARRLIAAWNALGADRVLYRSYEPGLDADLRLAGASGLIAVQKERIRLTETGKAVAEQLMNEAEMFVQEREVLEALKPISTSGTWDHLGKAKK